MEDNHQLTIFEYQDYKERIRKELSNVANGFVVIGYYLKKVRDSKAYEQDGYKSIAEYAQKEYGISQSTTSRFIKINDKYSEGGYSLEMQEQYKGLGSSRLTEMLTLPVEDHELITPETKIADIRALKHMDTEVDDTVSSPERTKLQEVIGAMLKPKRVAVEKVIAGETDIYEYINPSMNSTFKKGLFFITMLEQKVLVKEWPNTTEYTIEDFLEIVRGVYDGCTSYEDYYGVEEVKEEPKKDNPVATSQENLENAKEKATSKEPKKVEKSTEIRKNDAIEPEKAVEVVEEKAEEIAENVENAKADSNLEDAEETVEQPEEVSTEESATEEPTPAAVEVVEGTVEQERGVVTHELKILPEYYNQVELYNKTFELRKNDRDYKVGDEINLKEWNGTEYTGREKLVGIIYILENIEGLMPGYVIMSIDF